MKPSTQRRMPCRAAQAEAAVPQGQLRTCLSRLRQLRRLIAKQERCQASTIVACCVAVCAFQREGVDGILREQQPCNLGVMERGGAVEKAALAGQDCMQVGLEELRTPKATTPRSAKGSAWSPTQIGESGQAH